MGSRVLVIVSLGLALTLSGCMDRRGGATRAIESGAPTTSADTASDATPPASPRLSLPDSRAGGDLVGRSPDFSPARWIGTPVPLSGPAAAPATLVRFWTDTCPFCARSLPALEQLRTTWHEQGLRTVAIYHPKPPRPVSDEMVGTTAQRLGYAGPLGVDADWDTLRRTWLDTGARSATSASFLLDAEGVVRFVHPGPEFFPNDDPDRSQADRDYRDLEAAIRALLQG